MKRRFLLVLGLWSMLFAALSAQRSDPFMGNWKGRYVDPPKNYFFTVDDTYYAQVYPLGDERWQFNYVRTLLHRGPTVFSAVAQRVGDRLVFANEQCKGEITPDRIHGFYRYWDGWAEFELEPFALKSPSLGAEPVADATVLFDGSSVDGWKTWHGKQEGPPARIVDGALQIIPAAKGKPDNSINSLARFRDVFLHIEFRTEYEPSNRGQGRSNSGVFFQSSDEIQVLDSFGLNGYWDECGAIYRVAAPQTNLCLPPLQWQTYDAVYRAPRVSETGDLLEPAWITVYQNGYRIHHRQAIPARMTPARLANIPGPISLQDHSHPIRYRNIWALELEDAATDPRVAEIVNTLKLKAL